MPKKKKKLLEKVSAKGKKETTRVKKVKAIFSKERILADKVPEATNLHNKTRYGEYVEDKVQYSLVEALYLLERKRLNLRDARNKAIKKEDFRKKCSRLEKNFSIRYAVFKDLRNRGYIVKTALKFGADFRIYDKGVKPGEDHAKWIVYPLRETETLTLYEFSAKNRVAHSTRKTLLLAVVDDEGDVSYWNSSWVKP
ncbi:MAG: tRNA-intron lyase [Nanoarchaeota archaeon]|jgi:tRNA-intron endonuclease|nr:tRNA-intron lyase [Nanoarchaeota archaeon]|tara:strand:- start:322 stop:912 length:591 start_codon:yes stop_codon:yes gene_type:complete